MPRPLGNARAWADGSAAGARVLALARRAEGGAGRGRGAARIRNACKAAPSGRCTDAYASLPRPHLADGPLHALHPAARDGPVQARHRRPRERGGLPKKQERDERGDGPEIERRKGCDVHRPSDGLATACRGSSASGRYCRPPPAAMAARQRTRPHALTIAV